MIPTYMCVMNHGSHEMCHDRDVSQLTGNDDVDLGFSDSYDFFSRLHFFPPRPTFVPGVVERCPAAKLTLSSPKQLNAKSPGELITVMETVLSV